MKTLEKVQRETIGQAAAGIFEPQRFGAAADGDKMDTAAVQAAVDAAHQAGGGTVYFAPGRYVIGSVTLYSNVTLELANGAEILGSINKEDYRKLEETSPEVADKNTRGWQNLHEYAYFGLFLAYDAENISIRGEGVIDGRGNVFVPKYDPNYPAEKGALHNRHRPVIFHFHRCRNVRISGVTLKNPSGWLQCHLQGEGLRVEGVTIKSRSAWNNDGIDIVDTRDVIIRGCSIDCADDAICLKSTGRYVENVVVSDCVIRCSASAFKCGTGSGQGFRNITVNNLAIYDTARSGIALEVVDGGTMELVNISNITMRNVGNAIFIRLGDRARIHQDHQNAGTLRDVSISHVTAEITGFDADAGYAFRAPRRNPLPNPLPSIIAGLKNSPIQGLRLSNIQLIHVGQILDASRVISAENCASVPEAETAYPEYDQFGELPAWGLYVRHVEDLVLQNVSFTLRGNDIRPAVLADNVSDIQLRSITIRAEASGVALHDARRVLLANIETRGEGGKRDAAICTLGKCAEVRNLMIPEA